MKQFAERTKFNSIILVGTKEVKDLIKPSSFATALNKFVSKVYRDHWFLFGAGVVCRNVSWCRDHNVG